VCGKTQNDDVSRFCPYLNEPLIGRGDVDLLVVLNRQGAGRE
jgi:hypothetical protein